MKEYPKYYKELNAQQRIAVDAIDGPLLVLAGPGTGKTQLLSLRAGSIIKSGKARAENLLILTYTNSAAKTMKERLAKVIGLGGYDVEVCTFHSFANSIIQESEEAANYVEDKIQMDDVERMRLIEHILDGAKGLDDIRPFRAPYTYLKAILDRISVLKKDGVTPEYLDSYLKDGKKAWRHLEDKYIKRLTAFSAVYREYEALKSGRSAEIFDERGRYDYDDMIIFATEALKRERTLKEEYAGQYKYVMVDEYQDTNGAQLKLLFTLFDKEDANIACVGDDDQSIFRFQGASVNNFRLLRSRFPGIKTISLKENYRSTGELIGMSKEIINLIPDNERTGVKELSAVKNYKNKEITFREFTTEEEELLYIVDKVRELKDKVSGAVGGDVSAEERANPYNTIAVLVRKRADILKIVDAFLRAGIPYATDGKEDISGEKSVKQLIDVLELASIEPGDHTVKDLALYKVLTADYFRIPQSDVLTLLRYVQGLKRYGGAGPYVLEEFLRYFSSGAKGADFEAPDRIAHAHKVISRLLSDARTRSVHTILMDFIKEAGVLKFILQKYAENDLLKIRELRAITSFVNMVKKSDIAKPAIRLDEFMLEMKTRKEHGLGVQGSLVTMTQSGVRVYTAHGSKGLEFRSVIIPFCLHNKNWPARARPELIRLPSDLLNEKNAASDSQRLKELTLQDEVRLFYVASTRARSNMIFTASPSEEAVSSRYLTTLDITRESPPEIKEEELLARELEVTDMEDPFIGTEEVLSDMVADIALNPTRLNTYLSCRRKFLYNDILKLPGPKKKSLVFGNCVHKGLEETYKSYIATKKFPDYPFFLDAFRRELKFQGVDMVMERDCLNRADTLKEWFQKASRNPVMPIGLEKKLLITIGDNIIFTGKYDKVEMEDEKKGMVRILDYKTGKPDNHLRDIDKCHQVADPNCDGYLRQLVCYKLLFEKDKKESKGRRVGHGELVFIEPVSASIASQGYKKGEYVTKSILISDKMVEEVEMLIRDTAFSIRELRFEKLPSRDEKKCGMCDFDGICWE